MTDTNVPPATPPSSPAQPAAPATPPPADPPAAKPDKPSPREEMERVFTALSDSLTDNMVERLSVTAANALEIVDRLNDEDTKAAIHTLLDRLTEMHKIGALDTLFELVGVLHAAKNATSDSILERLFAFLEHMVNNVATEEMATLADNVRFSVEQALAETRNKPQKGGIMRTMRMVSKPEAQQTLQLLLLVGEKFRENALKNP